jgi:hypothetical protein
MSSEAKIRFKKGTPAVSLMERFGEKFNLEDIRIVEKSDYIDVDFSYPYSDFDEDAFMGELDSLKKHVISGCISFTGEDSKTLQDGVFRYKFISDRNEWISENAILVWPSDMNCQEGSERYE